MESHTGLFVPNTYFFENIHMFYRCKEGMEPTPKTFIRFSEKHRMQGLSYVVFTHRVSFNLNTESGSADISDMNTGTNVFPVLLSGVKSDSGFSFGLGREDIKPHLSDERQMTFCRSRFVYKDGLSGLVITDFEKYDGNKIKLSGRRMDPNDGTGFA